MRSLFPFLFLLLAPATANAQLDLTLDTVVDIEDLGLGGVGGAAFDDTTGRLWICDAGTLGDVFEIDPFTGALVSSFSSSVVPGLDLGPDALALHPTTRNLFLFSVFNRREAGEVTQAGVLVNELSITETLPAAGFDAGGTLYAIRDGTFPGLFVVDQDTGAVESPTPVDYVGRISALDFDPITGNLFAYGDATDELLEIDAATGALLSATDVEDFLVASNFPTGFAFNADGTRIFLSRGTGPGGDALIILKREPPAECLIVVGEGLGAEPFSAPGHTWTTSLAGIFYSRAVSLDDIPVFALPGVAPRPKIRQSDAFPLYVHTVQYLLWNPPVFPANPEQSSRSLRVTVWSDGSVTARRHGARDGMGIGLETFTGIDGLRYVRFPFSIDGF